METDDDLETLIRKKDHLNVLRYIRLHQLRMPERVVHHGQALLGRELKGAASLWSSQNELYRWTILEQVCLAALDLHDKPLAEKCLDRLKDAGISNKSVRFRVLLARCLEGAAKYNEAKEIYKAILTENPCNTLVQKRLYCIARAQVGNEAEAAAALQDYLQCQYDDVAAWYELHHFRKELGDFAGAAYALQEVLLGSAPTDPKLHCDLAECLATAASSETNPLQTLQMARQHMAQALELDPTMVRAQWGLVTVTNQYLLALESAAAAGGKKSDANLLDVDFERSVASELIKYGAEQLLAAYADLPLFSAVQNLLKEYTDDQSK